MLTLRRSQSGTTAWYSRHPCRSMRTPLSTGLNPNESTLRLGIIDNIALSKMAPTSRISPSSKRTSARFASWITRLRAMPGMKVSCLGCAILTCQENAIPIEGWISDPTDNDLLHLIPFLQALRFVGDVRNLLGLRTGARPR
jgi:hypothetical protein